MIRPRLLGPALAMALLVAAGAALAQTVTRAPYLQQGTPKEITIRWRTSSATDSRVVYGPDPSQLGATVVDYLLTTEHSITLADLDPGTRSFYAIGTSATILAGGDSSHSFVTPPLAGDGGPFRVWVIGDAGTGTSAQTQVRDAYRTWTGATPTALWLMLGDNAYNAGTDAEYQASVFNVYSEMLRSSVLWPTRGNHDALYGGANNDYYDLFTMPTQAQAGGLASGSEAYYSFDRGNAHFVCLDSEGSDRSLAGPMIDWLRRDLAATDRVWIVAYWHHPPYTKGSHNSDDDLDSGGRMRDMRMNVLPVLDSAGVDLVFTGHSHSYERSCLLNGHYGLSGTLTPAMKVDPGDGRLDGNGAYHKLSEVHGAFEGCVYVVAGSSGQISGGTLNHPAMISSLNLLGSMVLDFNEPSAQGPRMTARFLDHLGIVRDSVTVVKGGPAAVDPTPPRAGPLVVAAPRPNPFGREATLEYRLRSAQRVRISVLDAGGRRVRVIESGERGAGVHVARWDGCGGDGRPAPAGVYYAVVEAGTSIEARRLHLLR